VEVQPASSWRWWQPTGNSTVIGCALPDRAYRSLLHDHRLVTNGAYGVVRHPVYLAALLIWLGLGVAFASPFALGVAILYVLPAYLLYIRDEEAMMVDAFGDAYRSYRAAVPMLIPRRSRRDGAPPGAA
jgi:protein-S-isoprenylcysteine O-methyltransferase Ste14